MKRLLKLIEEFNLDDKNFDLSDKELQKKLFLVAEKLIKNFSLEELKELDVKAKQLPILFALVLKIAISKLIILNFDSILKNKNEKWEINVIFAVYKEHNRIKTKKENPNGEDFLNMKYEQMGWLFSKY